MQQDICLTRREEDPTLIAGNHERLIKLRLELFFRV
jgi:hypothetical protein